MFRLVVLPCFDLGRTVLVYIIYMLCAKYGFGPSDFAAQTSDPSFRACKPRIRTQSSGIAQPNLGHLRQQTHDRSRTQSSFLLRKPRIHTQSSGIAQPNLGHPRQQTHDRSRTQSSSAIRVNGAAIDRTRKAVRPSAAKKPRSIAHEKQLGHPRQRNHDRSHAQSSSAIRGKEATIDRARKAARPSAATNPRCRGWPSCFACAIDHGLVAADGRGLVARS